MSTVMTRVQVAVLLAVAQDYAFGQPPGAQLRATALAQGLAAAADLDSEERATTWWASTLRFLGCTGHAFEVAALFGDEIALRDQSLRADAANPTDMLRLMIGHAGPGLSGLPRLRSVITTVATGRKGVEYNFRTACEVADALAARLGLDPAARSALATSFERWNGRGVPNTIAGTSIPRAMRIAQLAQEFEVLARLEGATSALEIIRARRGRAYDPELTDLLLDGGADWWAALAPADPWDAALHAAPPVAPLDEHAVRDALLVIADFADLKSPWTNGHSREVAALTCAACGPMGEAAALVHDLGRVAVPNTIWDKPGPLTRDERDRAETVPLITEQLLTTRAIADRLVISPKTADHHVQHIYGKIGVSTRGAASRRRRGGSPADYAWQSDRASDHAGLAPGR